MIVGRVAGVAFRLPALLSVNRAFPGEQRNRIRFAFQVGAAAVGAATVDSALPFQNGALLEYFVVRERGTSIEARLFDVHSSEAAVLDDFVAPNVTAAYLPPVLKSVFGTSPTERFAFQVGTTFVVTFSGRRAAGEVGGIGRAYLSVWPTPNVAYGARFALERVR